MVGGAGRLNEVRETIHLGGTGFIERKQDAGGNPD
jgi:hypothetical protein